MCESDLFRLIYKDMIERTKEIFFKMFKSLKCTQFEQGGNLLQNLPFQSMYIRYVCISTVNQMCACFIYPKTPIRLLQFVQCTMKMNGLHYAVSIGQHIAVPHFHLSLLESVQFQLRAQHTFTKNEHIPSMVWLGFKETDNKYGYNASK